MTLAQGGAQKAQSNVVAIRPEMQAVPASVRVTVRSRAPKPDEPPLLRLLIVDDDGVAREAVRRALEESGLAFELAEASGEDDGNREIAEGEYDCVLLDYRFPRGEAFQLFSEVLSRSCDCRPPIVMLTGAGDERIAAGAFKQGAQDYLSKHDLDASDLRRSVEDAMEVAEQRRRLKVQSDLMHRLSLSDSLTDLPNRSLYLSRLQQKLKDATRRNEPFAVLMMDLNGFKEVNDSLGHGAGDQVLRLVARRLTEATRESDTVARYGGDEFAGIVSIGDDVAVLAAKLCRAFDAPMTVLGASVHVGLSVGVAMFPRDGTDSETLLHLADTAMYAAKRRGNGFAIHGAEAGISQQAALPVRVDAAQCPNLDQFEVYYEPQVDLARRSIAGVEAHVRWRHPQLGMLLPEKFVGAAQLSAMVRGLTLHVIACAAQQVRQWRDAGMRVPVSINLSPSLLGDSGLPAAIFACIAAYGMPPGCLTLEVTEASVMDAGSVAVSILNALAAGGVRIAIDDFGSGYSSCRPEFRFPVAELKIDRVFVHGIEGDSGREAVIRSIVEYGRGIGARVVAEGVDSDAARLALHELGCEFGQGAAFSAPASAVNYRHWHRRWIAGSEHFAHGRQLPAHGHDRQSAD